MAMCEKLNGKIRSFQCDGEFTEGVFKQFIDSCGLSLRLFHVHVHPQKRAAER